MTKKLQDTKSLMELDLDSFLNSSDSDDSDSNLVPHRTLDEILNDSDSSSSSSLHHSDLPLRKPPALDNDTISLPESTKPPPKPPTSLVRAKSGESSNEPAWRVSSSSTRQLPSLFGGVRSNAKPGAALAAAAAASRPLPTPHAAAIKSRRSVSGSLRKFLDGDDHEVFSVSSNEVSLSSEKLPDDDYLTGDFQSNSVNVSGEFSSLCSKDGDGVSEGVNNDDNEEGLHSNENLGSEHLVGSSSDEKSEMVVGSDEVNDIDRTSGTSDNHEPFATVVSDEVNDINRTGDEDSSFLDTNGLGENGAFMSSELGDFDKEMSNSKDEEEMHVGVDDDTSTISDDITELVEEKIEQLESKLLSRRAEKKSKPALKPLELAEELEKKQASTGLDWEEGAAAQPMRLEGVRRGSTTLGYFDVDASNTVTQTIGSQAFRRDHGSPQVLAVHLNFVAVGMSKGLIVVVPSRYSANHHDSMESKVCFDSIILVLLVVVFGAYLVMSNADVLLYYSPWWIKV